MAPGESNTNELISASSFKECGHHSFLNNLKMQSLKERFYILPDYAPLLSYLELNGECYHSHIKLQKQGEQLVWLSKG